MFYGCPDTAVFSVLVIQIVSDTTLPTMSIARVHGLADGDKMIKFNIPKIEDAAGAKAATATLVETYRRTVETVDIEERIAALESEPTN